MFHDYNFVIISTFAVSQLWLIQCQISCKQFLSTRCNIYISRLCYDVSVRLSVTEVYWHIVATVGVKFLSKFTVHCGRGEG